MTDTEFFAWMKEHDLSEHVFGLRNASEMLAKRKAKAALRLAKRVKEQEQDWNKEQI